VVWVDVLEEQDDVEISADGWGVFEIGRKGVAVWVEEGAVERVDLKERVGECLGRLDCDAV